MQQPGYTLPKSYTFLALGFFITSILVLVVVWYMGWARVTIVITPGTETVKQEFIFDVRVGASLEDVINQSAVAGSVSHVVLEGSDTFTASGSKSLESSTIGEVTIINNYSKDQTLVEKTRLAKADNPEVALVRISRTVVVPAGKQLKVPVYPENADQFDRLEPQKLIIPGLWQPLQDRIYAEVTENLTKGARSIAVVAQEDIDQAKETLQNDLYAKALAQINSSLQPEQSLWPKLVLTQATDFQAGVVAGEELSEFTSTMKFDALVVTFDESQVVSLARNRIKSDTSSNTQLISIDPRSLIYEVQRADSDTQTATVKVTLEAHSALAANADVFDSANVVGMTEAQVKEYFSQFKDVASVEVNFQPGWLKKTPQIKEKISITIAE